MERQNSNDSRPADLSDWVFVDIIHWDKDTEKRSIMDLWKVEVFWICWYELQLEVQVEKPSRRLDAGYMALEHGGVKEKYKFGSILG